MPSFYEEYEKPISDRTSAFIRKEKERTSSLIKQTLDLFRMSLHASFEDRVQCYEEAMKLCKDDV
jgi:hypothetical protein